jgi:hypothetical protein
MAAYGNDYTEYTDTQMAIAARDRFYCLIDSPPGQGVATRIETKCIAPFHVQATRRFVMAERPQAPVWQCICR